MQTKILIPLVILGGVPAAAHDFWIQPARFAASVGEPVPFTLLVGHGKFRQRWGVETARVLRFADIGTTGSSDRRAVLHTDSGDDDGTLALTTPGTHVIVMESRPAISTLPAIRFNDYLKVEGLTPAIARRAATGQSDADGRELYSRRAKTLIQVGSTTAGQPHVTRPAGLKLEIVPQKNPYDLKPGHTLPVVILYEGRPLSGASVKLNNLDFDAEPIAQHLSDAGGRAAFAVPLRGRWQLNVIWTKPISGNPNADFETIFSSLSFGYERPRTVGTKP
ncbi:MAG: DUF4198 domain-containing protein [Sandarakinorhabdus sp.]|nr:DUF4198 domain-containing protein [Sandarakinorhabdus sp.]